MNYTQAASRLRRLREKAAANVALREKAKLNYPAAAESWLDSGWPLDWRAVRRPCRAAETAGIWEAVPDPAPRFYRPDGRAYYLDALPAGWRHLGTAEEVSRKEGSRAVDHSGWFTDSCQEETVSGHVLQLPARGGVPQYVPAIVWSAAEGVTLYPLDRETTPLEAARSADGYAERAAETEREYQDAAEGRRQWDEKGDELKARLADRAAIRRDLAAMKGLRGPELTDIRNRLRAALAASIDESEVTSAARAQLALDHDHKEGWKNG